MGCIRESSWWRCRSLERTVCCPQGAWAQGLRKLWGARPGVPHSTASLQGRPLHSSGVAAAAAAGASTWCSTRSCRPCTGCPPARPALMGPEAFSWHTGENPLPDVPGRGRRGPGQGACPPAAAAEESSQAQLLRRWRVERGDSGYGLRGGGAWCSGGIEPLKRLLAVQEQHLLRPPQLGHPVCHLSWGCPLHMQEHPHPGRSNQKRL